MAYPNGQNSNPETENQGAQFQQKIMQQGQEALSSIEDSLKDFQGTMETAAKSTVEFVKKYPMQVFIGAAIVGAVCGAFLIRRNQEEI